MTDQKQYQLTSIVSPLLDQAGLTELVQKIKKWISDLGGSLKEEKITKRNLSYPVKKYEQAFYANLNFILSPTEIAELQKKLKLEENILRYLIIGLKPESVRPKSLDLARAKPFDLAQGRFKKAPPQREEALLKAKPKVKLEELDKKLEEILKE